MEKYTVKLIRKLKSGLTSTIRLNVTASDEATAIYKAESMIGRKSNKVASRWRYLKIV